MVTHHLRRRRKHHVLCTHHAAAPHITCTKCIKKAGVASGFAIALYTVGFVTVPINSTCPSYDSIA